MTEQSRGCKARRRGVVSHIVMMVDGVRWVPRLIGGDHFLSYINI